MPQVPYKPVPSVAPQEAPTPSVHLDTPLAAFGGLTAQAREGLGRTIGQAGNELFDSALRLQKMQNETWARNADVDVMEKIGQAQAEFDQLEGQNAVAALPAHMAKIRQIREEALQGAPNPESKAMLDSNIARRVGFAIVDSGARAGQQAKVALNDATKAQVETATRQIDLSSPTNTRQSIQTIRNGVRSLGNQHGSEDVTVKNEEEKQVNKALLTGITKLAPSDPQKASDLLEEHKKEMDDNTYNTALNVVNSNMARHQARVDASDLLAGKEVAGVKVEPFDPSKGPGQVQAFEKAAQEVGEKKGKNNPDYPDAIVGRVRANINIGLAGYRDTQLNNKYTVEQYIQDNKIVDIDGIAGPNAPAEVRDAYNSLNPDTKKAIGNSVRAATREAQSYTPAKQEVFNKLMGMADNQPSKFVELTLGDIDLPSQKKDQLFARQRAILKKTDQDNGFHAALGQLGPLLKGANISRDSDDYNVFSGALRMEWNDYLEKNKKPMSYDDLYKTGSRLLATKPGSWDWLHPSNQRFMDVPRDFRSKAIEIFKEDNGREPNEGEIRLIYNNALREQQRQKQRPNAQP